MMRRLWVWGALVLTDRQGFGARHRWLHRRCLCGAGAAAGRVAGAVVTGGPGGSSYSASASAASSSSSWAMGTTGAGARAGGAEGAFFGGAATRGNGTAALLPLTPLVGAWRQGTLKCLKNSDAISPKNAEEAKGWL